MIFKIFTTPQPLTSNLTTIFKKKCLLLLCYQSHQKKNIVIFYTYYTHYIPRVAKTTNDNVRRFYFMIFCFVIVGTQKYKTERKTVTKQQIYTQKTSWGYQYTRSYYAIMMVRKAKRKHQGKSLYHQQQKKEKEIKTFIEYPPWQRRQGGRKKSDS